jgi:acyl-CoA synthetase (AMP-forming)/AMP-acid ligase II/pimeloyl-ACP methyl ester carboxylesterase
MKAAPTPPTEEQWRAWGVDPSWSRTLTVDGSTWHLLERSPAHPVSTVVCIHGNPTWSFLWRGLLDRLGDRYRVIAVDQRGMGFSERASTRAYTDRVRDLEEVVDALDIDGPFTLIGHDWGGAIAMGFAVAHPDRLSGLVLCNTGIAVPQGRHAPRLIRFAASGPMTDLACRRTRIFVDGTIALSWRRLAKPVRDALRAPYRHAAERSAIADFVADVPFDERHPSSADIANVAEAIRSFDRPTLIVWGANDPVFDDSFALDLSDRLPHADLHRFRDAGHLSPLEVDVAGVIDTWLQTSLSHRDTTADDPVDTSTDPIDEYVPTWSALTARSTTAEHVAFVDGTTGARTSFAELNRRVEGIASGLTALGLRPGDRVAMLTPPGADLVAAVYGVWRAGGVTVIADRGLGLRGLGGAVRSARPHWVIGPPLAIAVARTLRWAPGSRHVTVGARRAPGSVATLAELERLDCPLPAEPGPDDPAAVLFTSGATGPAKGVRYRHRQLAAQRDALARTYRITADDRLVAAFAPFALYGPALGITSTIPDVDVTTPGALTADAFGAACASIDATIAFASPAALANVLRTGSTAPDPRTAQLRLVLSAGAPVPVTTLRQVAQRYVDIEVHTPYGMTECLPVADISLEGIDAAGTGRGVCVGRPVDGAHVLIAPLDFDATDAVVGVTRNVTGEVLVRTPWVSDGYDRRWGTEREARPRGVAGRVWHRSGDVGHLDDAGRLWIEGRSVHVVHTDRGAITPVPVEVAVELLDSVDRAAAVGIGPDGCQQLVVVIEGSGTVGLAGASVTAAVRRAVTWAPVAAVLTVTSLPVDIRHNTKIDRAAVAEWAARLLSGRTARVPW